MAAPKGSDFTKPVLGPDVNEDGRTPLVVVVVEVKKARKMQDLRMRLVELHRLLCTVVLCMGLLIAVACDASDESTSPAPVDPAKERLDLGTIFLYVQEVMNLDEEAEQVFVRWEQPVRYYLQGLEDHPGLETLFEEQVREIAEITSLDIARHDDLYLKYKDPKKRQVGPDGYSTTAAIFFTDDMEQAFEDSRVVKILKGFGDDPDARYEFWKRHHGGKNDLALSKFGFSRNGLQFYFYLSKLLPQRNTFKILILRMLSKIENNSNEIVSIYNEDVSNDQKLGLTNFDRNFLRIYYGDVVQSGMTKRAAAIAITEELGERFAGDKE